MSRSILLIGGNSGIGLATARLLVSKGDRVVAAARHAQPLVEMGIPVQVFDACSPSPLELPPVLDGLVYFPGTITLKPFHRVSDEDFLHDFQVNCLGAVAVIRHALPALKAAPSASNVLFSTVAVAQGMPFHAPFAAARRRSQTGRGTHRFSSIRSVRLHDRPGAPPRWRAVLRPHVLKSMELLRQQRRGGKGVGTM